MEAPKALYACSGLTMAARALGALMWSYARPGPFIWPSQTRLADELAIDARRVRRLLEELYAAGFARREDRDGHSGWLMLTEGTGALLNKSAEGTGALDEGTGTPGHGDPTGHRRPVDEGTGALSMRAPAPSEDLIEFRSEVIPEASLDQGTGTLRAQEPSERRAPAPSGHGRPLTGPRRPPSPFNGLGGMDGFEGGFRKPHFCKDPEELLRRYGPELFADLGMYDGNNGRPSQLLAVTAVWRRFDEERSRTLQEHLAIAWLKTQLSGEAWKHRKEWERDGRPSAKRASTRPKAPPMLGEGEYIDPETGEICST